MHRVLWDHNFFDNSSLSAEATIAVESTGVKPFMLECIGFLENQNLRRKLLTLSQSNNNA